MDLSIVLRTRVQQLRMFRAGARSRQKLNNACASRRSYRCSITYTNLIILVPVQAVPLVSQQGTRPSRPGSQVERAR